MSTTIEAASPSALRGLTGQAESRIIHFDATERRREKMRRAAGASAESAEAPAPAPVAKAAPVAKSAPVAKPAPVAVAPAAPKPAASPWQAAPASAVSSALQNGRNGSHAPSTNGSHSHSSSNGSAHAGTNCAAMKPAPAAAPAATSSVAGGMNAAELETFLINFVVEQTGYPPEMVELDADLEADLGIDSIKKAQLFGELAEDFDVQGQADSNLSLDDFPTLRHVLNFLKNVPQKGAAAPTTVAAPASSNGAAHAVAKPAAPVAAAPVAAPAKAATNGAVAHAKAPAAAPAASPAKPAMSGAQLETFLINFVVEQTGYPPEMVELDADLEADLGIDSIKKAQLFGELAEDFDVSGQADASLSLDDFPTLRHVVRFLEKVPQKGAAPASAAAKAPAAAAVAPAPVAAAKPAPALVSAPVKASAPAAAPAPTPVASSAKVAAAAPAAAPKAAAAPSAELESFLVNFVVEQTGYPPEMVELDADLEADLGIDSIKKAQLFGELAEHFDVQAAAESTLSLDDFPTLRHVLNFLAAVPRKG